MPLPVATERAAVRIERRIAEYDARLSSYVVRGGSVPSIAAVIADIRPWLVAATVAALRDATGEPTQEHVTRVVNGRLSAIERTLRASERQAIRARRQVPSRLSAQKIDETFDDYVIRVGPVAAAVGIVRYEHARQVKKAERLVRATDAAAKAAVDAEAKAWVVKQEAEAWLAKQEADIAARRSARLAQERAQRIVDESVRKAKEAEEAAVRAAKAAKRAKADAAQMKKAVDAGGARRAAADDRALRNARRRTHSQIKKPTAAHSKMIVRTELSVARNEFAADIAEQLGQIIKVRDAMKGPTDKECEEVDGKFATVAWLRRHPVEHPNCTRQGRPTKLPEGEYLTLLD